MMKQITCPHCADTYPDFDIAHVCSKGPYAPRLKPKMNERIKELAEQATTYIEPTADSGEGWIFDKEKFAELIVRECIGVVEGGNFLHDQAPTAVFARECSGAIKRHFGVAE